MFPNFEKFTLMKPNETTTSDSTGNNTLLAVSSMEIREKINQVLRDWKLEAVNTNEAIDSILLLFGVSPRIILIQQWEEDPDDKTGWSTWGWEYENGNLFDEIGYELEKVLEEDKYGHIRKALFKYVG